MTNIIEHNRPTSKISRERIRSILSASIGNLIEYFDWYVYSAFALYFSASFFPQESQTLQLLQSSAVFAVGFLMRPIGGWLLGSLADRKGRKSSMLLSVVLMSSGSFIIAFTPTYASIGIAAPILLVLARLLQGISLGGEYGISATYLSEMATPDRRGFYSSFQYVTIIGGQLLALGIQILLQRVLLTEQQLMDWGWRIPFIIGALLSIFALYLRSVMRETDAFKKADRTRSESEVKKPSGMRLLWKYPRSLLSVIGLTMGGTLAFYTYTTYMQKFLVNTVGLSKQESTLLSFCTLFIFALLQPVIGGLSDRIGRKPVLVSFGVLGTLFTIPIMTTLSTTTNLWVIAALLMASLIIVSGYTSINAIVKAELFPVQIRALGVGLPFALTVAIFGGTAEPIALYFKSINVESYFYWYITIAVFLSLIVSISMKDTRETSMFNEGNKM